MTISIIMDSNERGTDRAAALRECLLRHPDEYDFSFGDVEVDLVFSLDCCSDMDFRGRTHQAASGVRWKFRDVELKMPADFGASLQPDPQTGRCHLDDQRRNCPYSLQVAVLGSLGDVLRALPEVTGKGWRNPRERLRAEGMIRRGIAALKAGGVDVSFGLSPEDFIFTSGISASQNIRSREEKALRENMAQVVREARAYLEGDIHLPRAKCESVQEAMLMCLPGVGPERARSMIDAGVLPYLGTCFAFPPGGDMHSWYREVARDEDLIKVDGIGPKTAERILEAMR